MKVKKMKESTSRGGRERCMRRKIHKAQIFKVGQEFNFQSHSQPQEHYLDNHSTIFSSLQFKLGQ